MVGMTIEQIPYSLTQHELDKVMLYKMCLENQRRERNKRDEQQVRNAKAAAVRRALDDFSAGAT